METNRSHTVSLKKFSRSLLAGLFAAFYSFSSQAALLNDPLVAPVINLEAPGTVANAIAVDPSMMFLVHELTFTAVPATLDLAGGGPLLPITASPTFSLGLQVATVATGDFVGGIAGDDLVITGSVDLGGGDIRTGTLLTGEVTAFGFEATVPGTTTNYDARFTVNGGLLADLYPNMDGVIKITSNGSTFVSFAIETLFTGEAIGTVGAVPGPPVTPECPLEVTKSCYIEPPPAADFACSKPLDELTMVWDGLVQPVRIKAYKGDTSAQLLRDTGAISAANPGVMIGDEVTVNGYAGSPNDVYWEIFDAAGNLLGMSVFHLSCSDDDMDGETDDPLFPQDCGKREGNGKSNNGDMLNEWLLEGMIDAVGTLDCTADAPRPGPGGTPVTECEFTGTGGECTKRPTSISFRYHAGDDCMDSRNNQDSGKWSCTDLGMTPDPAHITIGKAGGTIVVDDLDVADEEVMVGDKGSSYDSEIQILIRNAAGGTMQEINMHSSCSQELKIGDRFGAIEIVGFTNEEQGSVGGGPVDVSYTYTITNNGPVPVTVLSSDDKLDPAPFAIPQNAGDVTGQNGVTYMFPGTISLDPFTTFIYTKDVLLDATTTNTLTSIAFGFDPNNLEGFCAKTAEATVTIAGVSTGPGPGPGPGPGACSVSAADSFKISKKKLEWKLTNTGSAPAVIESIDLSWPSVNGDLDKVKRDGDEIVSADESPTSAFITTFRGEAKKRTIKVGDTDTLKFEFRKNADRDPGKYAITVNFEGGCSVVF